jgi:hypothetical protein
MMNKPMFLHRLHLPFELLELNQRLLRHHRRHLDMGLLFESCCLHLHYLVPKFLRHHFVRMMKHR